MGKKALPVVTGISPAEGPPGTIVKIRGENLGNTAKDVLRIDIGKKNCSYTAEWQTPRLIHARTSNHQGMGDIIITTKSGGVGSSLVSFRGYSPRVGLLTESAVWVDESKLFEDKPSSTLSNSRMFSPNMTTYTDPLGVAPEETGAVLSPDLIEEWYKGTSSNPLSEDFNPSRFLLERHLDTGFGALKSGYYHLQSQDTRTSVGPTSFVRGNLTTILNALTTLNDIQRILMQHESESTGGDICEEMEGILKSCNYASISLFKDILTRKDDSDAKRNVLNVLHRYRFLFNLPRSIEKNIQQGEYEILISDFSRAKSLFQNTEVKSFQKALAEVDQKISVFAEQLKKKLFDFPTPLEEQKKIIRYLNDLDYSGSAGWECITKQSLWIKAMLVDCQVRYKSEESIEEIKSFSKSSMDFKANALKSEMSPVSQGLLMVEDLCKLISEHLTELWNLGQTFLSNQLGDKRDPLESANAREKFLDLVKDVIAVFCEITDNILHPPDKRQLNIEDNLKFETLVQWLPEGVNAVRFTLEKMDNLGLTDEVILPLKTLTMNSVADCVNKVLSAKVTGIQKLTSDEKWELNRSEKLYFTSELPYKFEKIFIDSLKFVRDFMKDSKSDSKSVLPGDVVPLLKRMFDEFLKALELTVYTEVNEGSIAAPDSSGSRGEVMAKDLQVLVLLSNCYHIKSVIVPRIMTQCVKFGYEELEDFHTEIDNTIDKLDERIFMSYIEMKGEPIIGAIEVGLNLGEYRWASVLGCSGVRQYVQDILMKLISIHNQVSSISTLFINRIFTLLVELISDELVRIYECIDEFSTDGGIQAALEINVLMTALENYMSEKAKRNFTKTVDLIPSLDSSGEKKMRDIIEGFKSTMWYQLSSFSMGEKNISHVDQDK